MRKRYQTKVIHAASILHTDRGLVDFNLRIHVHARTYIISSTGDFTLYVVITSVCCCFFLIRIFAFRKLLLSNLYRDIYYSLSLRMDIILTYIHYVRVRARTHTHTCKRNNSVFSFVPHCYCKHIAPSCHPRRKKEQSLKSAPNARVYLFCVFA